ncbi:MULTISPECIES: Co2+/Mg2+ efflux protein ApaG [Phyllobacteriaceae]|uniref:Co2+/Mg2+ efflux protein ApaG n=1 Tax=Phyllobacteriaceae TaxID=69277 RepID=UPI002ACAD55A|nr:Co2+/Mg2+ efflux protein ApaG [Chelativorans sp. M5D2P16]MDZ5697111.1 Co2+/Mg2+ efflux protein ApaG [Chelativorans sp. M5D2P16]
MYRAVTHDIEVRVEPFFLPDHSDPEESRYVWAYQVTIANFSQDTVKLISRYWHITDGLGRVQEVSGEGVIGEQPELEPGDSFQYTSGCPLTTSSGIMVGRYTMRTRQGDLFEVDIPAFSLDLPGEQVALN